MLKGKKALITGATSGIGKAIAYLFAEQGAEVALLGTNKERALEVQSEIAKFSTPPEILLVDISNTKETQNAVSELLSKWQGIDILVNNAGITKDNLLLRMTEEEWDSVLDVNLKSVFNISRLVIRPMIKAQKGKIINISSIVGLTGNAGQVNYAASKAGMIGFSKALAKELASRNICVNCIAPGYIKTPMTDVLTPPLKEALLKKIPLNRLGEPKDIASAALFFASHLSDYITGQVLTVDGGMVI